MTADPLDRPVHITLFPTVAADQRESLFCPLREFAQQLRDTRAPTKAMLPLFSTCSYDNKRTAKKSLKHDANVRECHCVVGDYDGERISFDDAAAAARRAGVAMVLVTTASHTPDKPHWRAVAPLAAPLHRNGTLREHARLTSCLAGVFPDGIHPESWTLSQGWFLGTTDNAPDHRVELIDGACLDELPALNATARPKPKPAPKPGAKPRPRAVPRKPKPAADTGDDQVSDDPGALVPADVADLLAAISQGAGAHNALVSLAGKFAAQGMDIATATDILLDAADARAEDKRDAGWAQMRNCDIARTLAWAYGKEAEAQGHLAAAIASAPRRARVSNGAGNGAAVAVIGNGSGDGAAAPVVVPVIPNVDDPDADPGAGDGGRSGGGGNDSGDGNGDGDGNGGGGGNGGGNRVGAGPGPGPADPGPPAPVARGMIPERTPLYAGVTANVVTKLLATPELAQRIAYDEMALSISLRHALPGDARFTAPRPWTDADTGLLQDWLQRLAQMDKVSTSAIDRGVDIVARMHAFHPVRNYLTALKWDGKRRLNTWLSRYLGVKWSRYAAKTGRWWLIGLVARIMRPGCRADYMLILEGLQGTQKSQVCIVLCGPWTSDQPPDIRGDSRAASQHLRGKWLCEISELAFFRQADIENLKAFLTRPVERYLPRYARHEVEEPRQCGFIGTTNHSGGYLHDPTGNRRFWPHRTGTIDIEALRRDRDQIWAEAVAAYERGEKWWPDREFEEQALQPEQAERYDADAWMEPITAGLDALVAKAEMERAVWAKLPQPKPPGPRAQTTLMSIWRTALSEEEANRIRDFDRSAQIRVRDILQFLGWQRGKRGPNGERWWVEPRP